MKARVTAAVLAAVLLAGCSNSVSEGRERNGICEQTVRTKFVGITVSTDRNHLNCGPSRR